MCILQLLCTCICDMNNRCILSFSICFILMICGYQTCSKLEFIEGSERLVSVVGSIVNITSRLDTHRCQSSQTSYSVIVSRNESGSHVDICKFRVKNNCSSPASPVCSCLSLDGPMLFSKKVSSDDNNTGYIWKWKDDIRGQQYKEVIFQIYDPGTTTHVPESTTFPPSIMIVISSVSSGGGVLFLTGLIIITAYICSRRGRRQFGQNPSPPHSYASSNHCHAEAVTPHSEQTGDIYEQMDDPLEMSTEHKGHSSANCGSGEKLPPSVNLSRLDTSTSNLVNKRDIPVCQTYPDGYLHPLYLPGAHLEQKVEFKTMHSVEVLSVKPKASRSSV